MVTYKIHNPIKQGNQWVVDVTEHHGVGITRRTTIPINHAAQFLRAIFHELPEQIEEKVHNGDV